MDNITFPTRTVRQSFSYRFVNQMRGRQTAVSGAETIIPSFSGYWEATIDFIVHGSPSHVRLEESARLEWQAFIAQMDGGLGTALIPFNLPALAETDTTGPVSQSSTAAFDTFEHWSFDTDTRGSIVLAEAAAVRATILKLALTDSQGLRPGHGFSIGDRFYRVQTTSDDGKTIKVQPPLRASAAIGTELNADQPVCKMRLASEGEGEVTFMPNRIDQGTVTFREAL